MPDMNLIYYFCRHKQNKMKKILLFMAALGMIASFLPSCDDGKTYAEMKEEEADAIDAWIASHDYQIISEDQFYAQDTLTDDNEFVLFEESGVYMNIVQKGPTDDNGKYKGSVLPDGSYEILSRFVEIAMKDCESPSMAVGDTLLANMKLYGLPTYELYPETYNLTISGTSYSAAFTSQSSYGMYASYGTTSVPSGWLVPLKYVKPARTQSASQVARVRILCPHSEGTSTASQYVYPCYYEITYNLN